LKSPHFYPAPWVIVCGGFHQFGGMDLANLSLCQELLRQGRKLFLVGHEFDPGLVRDPLVTATRVRRPLRSTLLGEYALSRTGRRVAKEVMLHRPDARILVNGGNCDSSDINWVHSVHSAWPRADDRAPLAFRMKSALGKRKAIRDEKKALLASRVLIANSERTKSDLIGLGIPETAIRVVYLGSSEHWRPATPQARKEARDGYGIPLSHKVIAFVGALGFDCNKGFDTLLRAFQESTHKNCHLLAAGGGRGLHFWESIVERLGLSHRVHLLGFSHDIGKVLNASDLLVSPARYEAYGLNVHEAICRDLPSIVTASAGVAEHYTPSLSHYLLRDPEDYRALSQMLSRWFDGVNEAKEEFRSLGDTLRRRSWQLMSQELIRAVENPEPLSLEDAGGVSRLALA